MLLHEAHKRTIANDSGLDAFHQSGAQLAVGQSSQHIDVRKDGERMMKAPDEVLALRQVHSRFTADRRVNL